MSIKKKLGTAAIFTGALLGTMHVVNRIFNYISTADNLLNNDNYEYYDWRFGEIAYKKSGSGKPLLLIHDLNVCSSLYEWNKIEKRLSKTNTVYRLDLLGCGCSDRPILTYTNYLYVQLITDFIKHIIGKKTDIIVSGESSSFVLMACSNDDSIIDNVVMINPSDIIKFAKIPTKRSKLIKYLLYAPVIGTFIYNMKVNRRTISEAFASSYYYNQNEINEEDILAFTEASQKEKTHSKFLYASQVSRFTNANIVCCLNKLTNSIFIITGNANPENILLANQYQNYLPSIEIIGIEKTKKMPHMEKPEEFINQIRILLSDEE